MSGEEFLLVITTETIGLLILGICDSWNSIF